MANLTQVLRQEIIRLGKKQARGETTALKKYSAQYRRDIAELKRVVAELQRKVDYFEKQEKKRVSTGQTTAPVPENARFRADGLKSHRERLGVSAADYAKLVGCSPLSIYKWESGQTRPGTQQQAKLIEVRGLGVREARQRLALLDQD